MADNTDTPGLGSTPFTLIFDRDWFPHIITYIDDDGNLQIDQIF